MNKEIEIPVLDANALEEIHFGKIDWKLPLPNTHNLFHINRLEDVKQKLIFPLPPHRKSVNDFIFLTNGSSVRTKGLVTYKFEAGQMFFLPVYQITTHKSMSADAQGFYVHFNNSIFQKQALNHILSSFSFLEYTGHPLVTPSHSSYQAVINILERLEKIYSSDANFDIDLIAIYLITLLTELNISVQNDNLKPKNASGILTQKYKEALSKHIYKMQKVSEYADFLNVTPNHLNKCVKSMTAKSAQELLNEMLILEAKSLLKYSNLNIAEIAVKLLNQTPSNFSRFFKSQAGMSPKEYSN